MKRPSELQDLLALATAELLTASRAARLGTRNLERVLKQVRAKYPEAKKMIRKVEAVITGMPETQEHLTSAESLLAVATKLAELEGRRVVEQHPDFLRAVAPGMNSASVEHEAPGPKTILKDTE